MLTYKYTLFVDMALDQVLADVCGRLRMRTFAYADVCGRMLTYTVLVDMALDQKWGRLLCRRMLMYADQYVFIGYDAGSDVGQAAVPSQVYSYRRLTYADAC